MHDEFTRALERLQTAREARRRGQTLRRRRHQRPSFPARGVLRLRPVGPSSRARGHPGGATRFARRVHRRSGLGRRQHRALGHRVPPSPAHRGAGGGGVFRPRPERLQRHAAQAQPHHRRTPGRPGARPARQRPRRPGERRPLARAGHQPQFGRTHHFPRFLHAAGLHARPPWPN